MKVFITGGSGFIASPLVRHLLEQGNYVKVLDLKQPSIKHKNLEFINKSITDPLKPYIQGCDLLFHFAALLGVDNSDNHPMETMKINLEGSVNVFECAMQAGTKHIIFSSSSEVYGEPRELPIREDSVKGPVSTYGVSKLASEIYAKAYNHKHNTDIKIVRFFNVYGPGQANNFVVPIFINNALQNKPLKVFGDGKQTRCFTFVEDIVGAVMKVVEKGNTGEAYNIGNNQPTTILELAQIVKEVTQSKSEIVKIPFGKESRLKERDIEYRVPDISKMKALGWQPKTMIKEGVRKMVDNLKS